MYKKSQEGKETVPWIKTVLPPSTWRREGGGAWGTFSLPDTLLSGYQSHLPGRGAPGTFVVERAPGEPDEVELFLVLMCLLTGLFLCSLVCTVLSRPFQ